MLVCVFFCAAAAVVAALLARLTTLSALAIALLAATAASRSMHGSLAEWRQSFRSSCRRIVPLIIAAAIAIVAGSSLAAFAWRSRGLPAGIDGVTVRLSGTVTAAPSGGAIEMRTSIPEAPGAPRRTVQFYPGRGSPDVMPGAGIVVSGILTLPRPPGNPGGFDAAVYARTTGIAATIDDASGLAVTRRAPAWRRLTLAPARAGERAAAILSHLFAEPDATLLYGLIFGGDSGQLPAGMAADFRRAGVLHLLAASGSNVAFILGAAIWVLRRFCLNRQALGIGLAIVAVYWLMTGGGASIGRAALMAVIVIVGQLVRRRPDSLTSLALSAALLTLVNPLTALDAGFQLSFGATWGLLSLSQPIRDAFRRRRVPDWLATPLAVTFGAQAGVLPVSLNLFGEQSLISPLTNLVALPLAGGAVVTGSLCCLLGALWLPLAVPAAAVTAVMLRLLTASVAIGAHMPLATVALPAMPLFWSFAYYACAATAGAHRRAKAVAVVLALTLLAVALRPAASGPGDGLRITFLDVRQGDSALVELPDGRRLLVDCGDLAAPPAAATGEPTFGPGGKYDAAGRAIVPFLRRANIRSLDAVIITHDHADHNGGLPRIKQAVRIGSVLGGGDLTAGQSYTLGGVAISILWPRPDKATAGNDDSVVIRLSYAGRTALLTGDIEAAAEAGLVSGGARLRADVLKVAHHGGASSSGEAFLAAVEPRIAVISVGAGNSFGHPSVEALARLTDSGARILRTDRFGAIRIAFSEMGLRVWHWDGRAWRAVTVTGTRPNTAKTDCHGLYCSQ